MKVIVHLSLKKKAGDCGSEGDHFNATQKGKVKQFQRIFRKNNGSVLAGWWWFLKDDHFYIGNAVVSLIVSMEKREVTSLMAVVPMRRL